MRKIGDQAANASDDIIEQSTITSESMPIFG